QQDDWIYLSGNGASPEGDRPFLDRLNLRTFRTERLFRCDRKSYESFVDLIDPTAGTFLTERESPTEPTNFMLRTLTQALAAGAQAGEPSRTSTTRALTRFPDPAPQLRGISK